MRPRAARPRWAVAAIVLTLLGGCRDERPAARDLAFLETSRGTILVELLPESAPLAVENFERLADSHYYDGTIFHRVIPEFVIQGGDPTGTGTGGESVWGHDFADEFDPKLKFDEPWRLGMANRGPNTNGSQFFISLVPTPWLDGKYTIFGNVIAGRDVAIRIATTPRGPGDRPVSPVILERVWIQRRAAASS